MFINSFKPILRLSMLAGFLLTTLISCASTEAENAGPEEWVELFNGENLDGWDLKIRGYELNDNFNNTFRVEDGLMKVRYDEYDQFEEQFGHIFYEEPFSYYRLQVEYRFIGEQVTNGPAWAFRNNGIMFHGQSAASMELDQDFPASIEYQLLGGDGENERSNGNICTPGTHVVIDGDLITDHCISSSSSTNHGDEWVTAELVALGSDEIRHLINGEVVMEYTKPQLDQGQQISSGYISLQAESHPADIRSVRILNLEGCMDDSATNYKSYFVKDDPHSCEY
ncbi:MAG: DUF1080 domain-containing protein [Balneolaceae bacterium]